MRSEVVVVTGASAGLGRAIVREFAKRKAKIGLIARNPEALENARDEVIANGGDAIVLPCDVGNPEAVFAAAAQVEDKFGAIDVWINNAMVSVFSPVREMKHEEFKRVTDVNYLGYVYGTLAALRSMRRHDRGHIVQVGSALSHRAIPLQSAYCASKFAIRGFTESLRTELLHEKSGIKLGIVEMPAMNTPQFRWVLSRLPGLPQPVPPIYQPEVGARAVVQMVDHPVKELNLGFSTLEAEYAEKIAPAFADLYLSKTGCSSQQMSEWDHHDRPSNLWAYVPGDHGAHGVFDDRARETSVEFELYKHRYVLGVGAAAVVAAGLFGFAASRATARPGRAAGRAR